MRLKIKSQWHILTILAAMLLGVCNNIWAQTFVVTGIVTDAESGTPLPGVNVIIEGTQQGTITNINGLYELTVPSDQAKLNFSFIGYNTLNIEVAGRTVIDVKLLPELQALDEVVVIGYGTMRKKDLTGSVASVKASDIAANKGSNALELLQGKVAGLDLVKSSGQTGSGLKLTLRGVRSINASNEPLILVDGVEYGSTLDINAADIQSVDVLKDAASTAIYGTRGANGVIIITTKKGETGKMNVSYNSYVSHNTPVFIQHIQNGAEYADKYIMKAVADAENGLYYNQNITYDLLTGAVNWDQTAYPNPTSMFGTVTVDGLVASRNLNNKYQLVTTDLTAVERMVNGVSIDYLDLIMINSWSQNHEFSVTGGNDKTTINFSLGYLDDNGMIRRDALDRYNVKIGVDQKFGKSIQAGADVLFTKKYHFKRYSGIFNTALKCGPVGVLYNEDGTYSVRPDGIMEYNQYSPMLDEVPGANVDEVFDNRLFGVGYINWNIIPGLSFRSSLAADFTFLKEGIFMGPKSIRKITKSESESQMIHEERTKYTWDNVVNYSKTLGKSHRINAMIGSSVYYNETVYNKIIGYNQPLTETEYYDFNAITSFGSASDYSKYQMLSFFGRINYSLNDKYLFQATIRNDGSSVLYKDDRWSSFPSASVGWRLSEEEFLKNFSFINNLKLRYSWGIAGNAAIKPYMSLTKLGNIPNYYSFGNQTISQYVPFQPGNKELTWEATTSHNIGLDFGVLNNRIFGAVDFYASKTKDLIFEVLLPYSSGFPITTANVAGSENTGVELSLTTVNMKSKVLEWSTDWTFALNRNKITALRGDVTELIHYADAFDANKPAMLWKIGSPMNSWYTYDVEGIYSVEDLQSELNYIAQQKQSGDSIERGRIPMVSNGFYPGNIKLADKNNDGQFKEEDKILMNADPDYILSLSNTVTVKTKVGDFGFYFSAIGRIGQTISYDLYQRYKTATDWTNGAYVEAWTPTNTGTRFPRYSSYGNGKMSTFTEPLQFIDGSFVKIKDVTLSYFLPNIWVEKIKISNLRVYMTLRNMRNLIFSSIENYDPENNGSMNFPLSQQVIFGLNLDF
ncbi:MAG: TonB-dependent receptor [Bacteroidales bacterium]